MIPGSGESGIKAVIGARASANAAATDFEECEGLLDEDARMLLHRNMSQTIIAMTQAGGTSTVS